MIIEQAIELDNELEALGDHETLTLPNWKAFSNVTPKEQPFLIPGIPENNITLFVSDGGTGKSILTCHLAAAISTGSETIFDNEPVKRGPARVILVNTEDSNESVIVQRLIAAGADLSLIDTRDDSAPVPAIGIVIARIEQIKPKLVILDPLQSFVPEGAAMERRNVMRKIMEPLQQAAALYKCAIVIVMHTNKRLGASGRSRVADSADMWDIARSVFILGDTKDGEYTRYISHEKNSYGKQLPTMLFRINDQGLHKVGETEKKDYDYVTEHNKHAGGRPAARRENAESIIIEAIEKAGGSMTGRELKNIAAQNDISSRMLDRIRAGLVKDGLLEKITSGYGGSYETRYKLCDEF